MVFAWYRRRRRQRLLAQPFPPVWEEYLQHNVWHYRTLNAEEQARLRNDLRVFVAEKYWEGCGGQQINDEVQVTIAAQACLLLLGLEHDYFPQVVTILVYPNAYLAPQKRVGPDGVVREGHDPRFGEAWYRGPVILSWSDALAGGRHDTSGQNLVLHEFAHQLDMEDRDVDGVPPLRSSAEYRQWHDVMTEEYRQLVRSSELGRATLLDQYGATDRTEFFAVATECFFQRAGEMRARHQRLYDTLRTYYRQDPASRLRTS